jgi:predicted methyltransferase
MVRKISNKVAFLSLTRHTESMVKKKDIIRLALNQKGIVITDGIPEHIIELLRFNGYKIKVRKKVKKWT